jgi:hypothetical protein
VWYTHINNEALGEIMNETTIPTSQTPLFLLDIDGVLNLFDAWEQTGPTWWDTKGRMRRNTKAPAHLREARSGGYSLLLHPDHPDMIAEIEGAFETVWATMWQSSAHLFGTIAGFGVDWGYIDFDSFHEGTEFGRMTGGGVGSYKDKGIKAILGSQPGVWVDDDMTPAQHAWAQRRTEDGIPTLFIQPDPEFGMTREHFERIMAFANEVADARIAA